MGWKIQWKVEISPLIVIIYCITNVWIIYRFSWIAKKQKNKKKPAINYVNHPGKCFQYAATVPLKHEQIRKHSQRISTKELQINIIGKELITNQEKLLGKRLRKVVQQLLLMCYRLKDKYISWLHLKTQLKSWKTKSFS